MTRLLADQPATRASDKLRFDRTLKVIDRLVLVRRAAEGEPEAPFVVGLFGRWGSGKSTLLNILAEHLEDENERARQNHPAAHRSLVRRWLSKTWRTRLGFLADPLRFHPPWIVVEFSPWQYRNQPSLLVPLLATLAKKQPRLWQAIRKIAGMETGWIGKLIAWLTGKGGFSPETFALAVSMQSTLTLLQSLDEKARKNREAKDLAEQIADAVKEITHHGTRLAFLIDDLDRCHAPAQIVGLLEQIKLFLHLPACLFFIAADRGQIVRAIETQFPGEGERYLEKFVQLALELPQPEGQYLLGLLPEVSTEERAALTRAAEVLDHNPRKLKALWNRAQVCLALLREDLQGIGRSTGHQPSLPCLLRWLLIREAGWFDDNPYAVLELEEYGAGMTAAGWRERFDGLIQKSQRSGGKEGEPLAGKAAWPDPRRERLRRQLEVYLWHDETRFGSPAILSLYLKATGEAHRITRQWLEQRLYEGETRFASVDFFWGDLRNAGIANAVFEACDFKGVDFSAAMLDQVRFERCDFTNTRFDGCGFGGVTWSGCTGLQSLDTEPDTYEKLADLLVEQWERNPGDLPVAINTSQGLDTLYKTYIRAYECLEERKLGNEEQKTRLLQKSQGVRDRVKNALR